MLEPLKEHIQEFNQQPFSHKKKNVQQIKAENYLNQSEQSENMLKCVSISFGKDLKKLIRFPLHLFFYFMQWS